MAVRRIALASATWRCCWAVRPPYAPPATPVAATPKYLVAMRSASASCTAVLPVFRAPLAALESKPPRSGPLTENGFSSGALPLSLMTLRVVLRRSSRVKRRPVVSVNGEERCQSACVKTAALLLWMSWTPAGEFHDIERPASELRSR